MAESNSPISRLIDAFASLPSIGKKSAERLAYHVLKMPNEDAIEFAESIRAVKENLKPCRNCFNLSENEECTICEDPRRDPSVVCVVEQVRDLLAIEQAGTFRGVYHVLQGRLAPLDGVGPEKLSIETLISRLQEGVIKEVIMGTTPNVEGDGTALAIANRLAGLPVTITRLARGLTVGASLEQANQDMLADAIASRQPF
ncbi:MAG: recombination protein RecR [Planctomycetaceae bacterium]|jgi:recombination protein RecR|nr:recombination protein RecR [Planctomycetaceae bacterium]